MGPPSLDPDGRAADSDPLAGPEEPQVKKGRSRLPVHGLSGSLSGPGTFLGRRSAEQGDSHVLVGFSPRLPGPLRGRGFSQARRSTLAPFHFMSLIGGKQRLPRGRAGHFSRVSPVLAQRLAQAGPRKCLPKEDDFLFLKLIIYFWLCWIFVAVRGLSLVAASGSYSSLWWAGFSLRWLLLLRSTGSRCAGFSSCGMRASVVVARGLSSCGSRALGRRLSSCGTRA